MQKPELGALVAHYQESLRLRDWEIVASYRADLKDSRGHDVWGLCARTVDAKSATLLIRDPSTPPAGVSPEEACKEVVETVVHELVHLHLAPFGTSSPAEVAAEEQAAWALSAAIVKSGAPPSGIYARRVAPMAGPTRGTRGPTPAQLQNRAVLRRAFGLAENAPLSAISAALRSRVSKSDREVLDEIAAVVGAPPGAEPFDVYQAMSHAIGGSKASDPKNDAVRAAVERVGMLLFDGVGADVAAVFEEFKRRFKLGNAPTVARRAPARPMTAAERRRLAIEVGRTSFKMGAASDADVEVRLYRTRPEIMPSRTVSTRFGTVTLSSRELARAAEKVSEREKPGAAFERLVHVYAEMKAEDERARRGARKG